MSFTRLIYYSAMVGGWAAFLGWLLGEVVLLHRAAEFSAWKMVVTAALCGALIGGGLNCLAGLMNGQIARALPRLGVGLALGFVSGAIGSLLGNLIFVVLEGILGRIVGGLLGRMIGWTVMGASIGVVEGLYDLNVRKIRNGVLGGTVGGMLGGFLFWLSTLVLNNPMSSRAVSLVILGACIGVSIGLAQVMLRDAWLTVEDGFRPGRQLMLGQPETYLGTSEKAGLIFIAFGAKGVEPLHVCVVRRPDGTYEARDNGSRTGTFVNDQQVAGTVPLRSGDLIRFGVNKVRFNERYRAAGARTAAPPAWQPAPAAVPVASAIRAALPPAPQPQAVQAVRPMPPSAVPVTVPKPPMAKPQAPTAAPVPVPAAPQPPRQAGSAECPICGTPAKGKSSSGKRRCENCGSVF
jgi:hypothetical protein